MSEGSHSPGALARHDGDRAGAVAHGGPHCLATKGARANDNDVLHACMHAAGMQRKAEGGSRERNGRQEMLHVQIDLAIDAVCAADRAVFALHAAAHRHNASEAFANVQAPLLQHSTLIVRPFMFRLFQEGCRQAAERCSPLGGMAAP